VRASSSRASPDQPIDVTDSVVRHRGQEVRCPSRWRMPTGLLLRVDRGVLRIRMGHQPHRLLGTTGARRRSHFRADGRMLVAASFAVLEPGAQARVFVRGAQGPGGVRHWPVWRRAALSGRSHRHGIRALWMNVHSKIPVISAGWAHIPTTPIRRQRCRSDLTTRQRTRAWAAGSRLLLTTPAVRNHQSC